MESSQLKRISIIALSVLCLSPVEFFSNKLFESKSTTTVILATNDIKYKENYLSNSYEIFNPNIKATSETLKNNSIETLKTTEALKERDVSDHEEDNLESEDDSENIENNEEEIVIDESVIEVVEEIVSTEEISTEVQEEAITEFVGTSVYEAGPTNTDLAASLVNYALQFVGNPYRYGGTDLYNGIDCSGFTMKVYENFGYSLPHSASSQSYNGAYVSLDSLEPGDLIFYGYSGSITHVALYIGGGQIVHAATTDTGIQVANLRMMPIITARRIINN